MNDNRDFDRAVDRWLDDGSDATPAGVIDAVLLVARSTPQERDFRISWRSSPMKTFAYAVAAVAAVAVSVAALSALGPRFGIGSDPSTTPVASALTGCPGISASGDVLTVGWCPTRPDGHQVRLAFTLTTTAASWLNGEERHSDDALFFRPYGYGVQPGGTVAISVDGPATLEAWVALITGETAYTVSEPQPISIGGADGYVIDVSPGPGHVATDVPPLVESGEIVWGVDERTSRVWLIERDGQPVMFVTRANFAGVDSWTTWVSDVLETLTWD